MRKSKELSRIPWIFGISFQKFHGSGIFGEFRDIDAANTLISQGNSALISDDMGELKRILQRPEGIRARNHRQRRAQPKKGHVLFDLQEIGYLVNYYSQICNFSQFSF